MAVDVMRCEGKVDSKWYMTEYRPSKWTLIEWNDSTIYSTQEVAYCRRSHGAINLS